MDKTATVKRLIDILLGDMPECSHQASAFEQDPYAQRVLLRGLMNMHKVDKPLSDEYFKLQDELLQEELSEKKIEDVRTFEPSKLNHNIRLFRGDITTLKADAIVNAANNTLLGCFIAGHLCIDNCIHSASGLQLRYKCKEIIDAQGHLEDTGCAKITLGYNLPCKHIIHTVGPIVNWQVTPQNEQDLRNCYTSCMQCARDNGLKTIVFCCISTGAFHYPHSEAAKLAVKTVNKDLEEHGNDLIVIFNTFEDLDTKLYEAQLDPSPEIKDDELHPFFNPNLF